MSEISQTTRRQLGFGPYFALSLGVVAVILLIAMGPSWRHIAAVAGRSRPHAPDLAMFAALSPAIQIHLLCALAAVGLGAVLMTLRKGRSFHRAAGWVWAALVLAVAGSSIFIQTLKPGHWSVLHLFTGWTFLILPLAVLWAKRHDVKHHRRAMMGLFYGGFAVNLLIALIPGRTLWTMLFG